MTVRSSRFLFKALALALAYFACAMVARGIKANPNFASVLWLPWGLLFGALLVSPRREWLWLLLATLPVDFAFNLLGAHNTLWIWSVSRFGSYFSVWVGVWLTHRFCQGPPKLESVRELTVLFVAGGLASQTIAATCVTYCWWAMGVPGSLIDLWLSWYTVNIFGFMLLTPAIVLWYHRGWARSQWELLAGAGESAGMVALYGLVLSIARSGNLVGTMGLQSAVLVIVVWAAIRLGTRGVVTVNAFVAVLAVFFPVRNYGTIGGHLLTVEEKNFMMVLGLAVIGFAGLLIAVAIEAQRTTEDLLVRNNAALAEAVAAKELQAAKLTQTNATLQEVLARAESLARDLGAANKALSAQDQAKLEFVRSLSHELRNPIAGARMMTDCLLRTPLDPQSHRDLSNLMGCIVYLQTLLDDTLDITQIESGQVAARMEAFTLEGLLIEVASIFEHLAREKGLEFEVDAGPEPEQVLFADKTQTKRILINYLSNAFKFTTAGKVTLRVTSISKAADIFRVRFEVADTGVGMSEALQARLFGKFIRGSSRVENETMLGAGLGLALCKQLATLAGGSVGFATREGKGSTFWTELPFVAHRSGNLPADETELDRPDFSELSVCLIDDDPLQLEVVSSALGQFGVVPEVARNTRAGMDLLKAKRFNVAFLDYHIAEETGLQLLVQFREQCAPDDFARTHYHLITALWEEGLVQRARAVGFNSAHRKPLSIVGIYAILRAAREAAGQ